MMMMMIAMMIVLPCLRASVLVTTNAAFHLGHQIQALHELGYYQKADLFPRLSRKLILKKMDEGYGDQDLVYNDKQMVTWKRGEEVMAIGARGSDPTQFTTMDYSRVRRRRPIHNNSSPKSTNSP